MKALTLLFVVLTNIVLSKPQLKDSVAAPKSQPDSVTRKIVHLLVDARDISDKKPAEALKKYRTALVTNKLKDDLWEANVRLEMGRLLYRLKSKDALPQLLKAEALFRKKANLLGRAQVTQELATIYEAEGQFSEALKNYNALYKIQYRRGEPVLAGNVATYLTDKYIKTKNFPEAFKYADMAKTAYYSVCRTDSLGSIYYRIAYLKRKMNSPKSAEYYILSHALPYYRSADDLKGRLKSFDFLGELYKEQKKYSEAKWFFLQANNQAMVIGDTTSAVNSLVNLSVVKIHIGDLALAKKDWDDAKELAKISGDSIIIKKARVRHKALLGKLTPQMIAASNAASKKKLTSNKQSGPDLSKDLAALPARKTSGVVNKPTSSGSKSKAEPAKPSGITKSTEKNIKSKPASSKDSAAILAGGKSKAEGDIKDSVTKPASKSSSKSAPVKKDSAASLKLKAAKPSPIPAAKWAMKSDTGKTTKTAETKPPVSKQTVRKTPSSGSSVKSESSVKSNKPATAKAPVEVKKDSASSKPAATLKPKLKTVIAQKPAKPVAKKIAEVSVDESVKTFESDKYEQPLPYEKPNK